MPAVLAPEVFKTVLLHQATQTVGMKQIRWLEPCCVLVPLAATRKICQWLLCLDTNASAFDSVCMFLKPHKCTRQNPFKLQIQKLFFRIQNFLKKSRMQENINSKERPGGKMHQRANRMETERICEKKDQWENLISSSCQSSFIQR